MITVLFLLFAQQFLFGSALHDIERGEAVLAGVTQGALMVLGVMLLLGSSKRRQLGFEVSQRDRSLFIALGLWLAIAIVAALQGLSAGNEPNYIIGDLYRLASLCFWFGLMYFGIDTPTALQKVLRGFLLIFLVVMVKDWIENYDLIAAGTRLTTNAAYYVGNITPLVVYRLLREPQAFQRVIAILVVPAMLVSLILYQGLRGFVFLILPLVFYFLLRRRLSVALVLVVALGAFLVAFWYVDAFLSTSPAYLHGKIELALASYSPEDILGELGGRRLGEVLSISHGFASAHQKIALGFGLGGELAPEHLHPVPYSSELPGHYIHTGLFEVTYRTGLAGTIVFLFILAHTFRRGYCLYAEQGEWFGLFTVVNIANQLLMLATDTALTTPFALLAISFVGVSVLQRAETATAGAAKLPAAAQPLRSRCRPSSGQAWRRA